MSDWDLLDKNENVPRNDPKLERKDGLTRIGSPTATVIRAGVNAYKNRSEERKSIRKFSVEEVKARRQLRRYVKENNPEADSFAPVSVPDPILLNFINIILFLVIATLLQGIIRGMPGVAAIIIFVIIWQVSRGVAKSFLKKRS